MFIYLDESLLVEETDPIYLNVIRAIRNLALAAFESKHILYGDFEVIEAMRAHFRYDPDVSMVFNNIYQMYSVMACPEEITYYLKVAKESSVDSNDESGKRYGQVSYSVFEDTRSTQECNLISEDYNDCTFYRRVLDYYKKLRRVNIPCCFNDECGSGNRTKENVRKCVYEKKQITVCVVDTDKKYPTQAIPADSTYGVCSRAGMNIPTYKFVELDVHEIENLIPFNVTDKMTWYAENRRNKRAFDGLRNNAKSEYVLRFFDIKKGIINDELLRTDPNYRSFAMTCYYLHPDWEANGSFETYYAGLEENAEVYPHLILNLLKKYLDYVNENPGFEIELLEYQRDEWDKIGSAMLNMGCSRNTEAIV